MQTEPNPTITVTPQTEDFSLVLGGPLYQALLRSGLVRPPLDRVRGRIAVLSGFAWLPLVLLTLIGGRFAGGVRVPFLYDFEVHARLLLSLPLLLLAELIVHLRTRALTSQFLERHIIPENLRPSFSAVVSSAMRLRDSVSAEIVLLLLVFAAGPWLWRQTVALHSDTWYATGTASGAIYTAAGWWYGFVSIPVFQFILLRWYYRLFIWWRFLFQVSRFDLNLVPTHPDRCCGLGFLANVSFAFGPLLMAHSVLISGFVANRILHEGATLPQYKVELIGMVVFLLAVGLGPLCVFTPKLNGAKLMGLRTYGRLASDYVTGFAQKWAGAIVSQSEPLLGSADIQSLADLDTSFSIIRETRLVPFGKETVVQIVVIVAVPLLPLALTMFSAEELIKRLIGVIL
jgi:hypothetical protein